MRFACACFCLNKLCSILCVSDSAVVLLFPLKQCDMTGKVESDNEDQWLEEEIQQQLDQLDDSCLLSDDEQCSHEINPSENNLSSVDAKVIN